MDLYWIFCIHLYILVIWNKTKRFDVKLFGYETECFIFKLFYKWHRVPFIKLFGPKTFSFGVKLFLSRPIDAAKIEIFFIKK